MKRTTICGCAITGLAIFATGDTRDRDAHPAGIAEGIVHTTLRPGNLDIYLFETPGEDPVRLTDHPALDYNATFSPDGRWLVFTSERSGNPDLWALQIGEDNEPLQLTHASALDDAASFSPDGRQLAFVSTREGDADIFVMPFTPGDALAGQRATNLTRRPGGDFNPAFSPDGRRIAYSRQDKLWPDMSSDDPAFDANGADLYVMAADGSDSRELVGQVPGPEIEPGFPFGSVAGSPAWSADGESVYYYRVSAEGREIRKIRPDGSLDEHVAADGLSPAVTADDRVVFSRPDTSRGLDAMDVLWTGRIVSVSTGGASERQESGPGQDFLAPDVDRGTGRIVAHGPAPTNGQPGELGDGFLFAPPGGRSRSRLPDRELEVWAVRGFFPALTADGHVVSTIFQLQGTLNQTLIDGSFSERLSIADGLTWGATIARQTGMLSVAVGPFFAPGSEEVDIWTHSLGGGMSKNVTADVSANDALPNISQDGRRIVFRTGGDGGVGRVLVMDTDGGGRRRLTDFDAAETMPALSPDGEWVVFSTNRVGGWKLWIQRVDGSDGRFLEPLRLDIPDTSMHPRFSPDGKWVVATSDRGGFNDEWPLTPVPQPYGDLWAVSVADGTAVRLMHNKWEDGPNDWGPLRLPARSPGTEKPEP